MTVSSGITVDDYIASQSAQAQARLRELRQIILAAVPRAEEGISYGIPTYHHNGKMVSFGAAKHHCALYGTPQADFTEELKKFKTLKGTVQFPLDQPVPAALVRKLVIAKLA